jgi:predicted alpha/beta hydrolase
LILPALHQVKTEDGIALRVVLHASSQVRFCIVIQAALGTPQERYAPLAAYLAERGFAAITYDYRDMGANRNGPAKSSAACVSEWGRKDQTAVLKWARAHYPESRLIVLGHSMGGQILGFTPRTDDIDGVVLVSAQSTYYKHWEGAARWKMRALWSVALPGINQAFGYMPGSFFGGEDLPGGCTPEGTRWALRETFIGDEHGVRENLAKLCCPVLAYSFSDDEFHAPKAAVKAFLAQLHQARVHHRHVAPSDFGLARIGHFGFFSPRSKQLWEDLCARLEDSNSFGDHVEDKEVINAPTEGVTEESHSMNLATSLRSIVTKESSRLALRDVFADLVRFSREIDQKGPLTEEVRYGLHQDPIFGELPVAKLPMRYALRSLPLALQWKYTPIAIESGRYTSVSEAHQEALRYFGTLPAPEHYECSDEHLSDEWLHHMICTKFSLWLEPNTGSNSDKSEYKFDLSFMSGLEAAPGYERHSGKVVIDESKVLYITHHGKDYFPKDPDWELIKYKVRAASFAWVTLLHAALHLRESAKLFTATYQFLSPTHPLRILLLPYLYGTHRNVARLQRTVIGPKGAVAVVSGFSSGSDALDLVTRRMGVRLCPEYKVQWTQHYKDTRAIWDILYKHVSEYVNLYKLDAASDKQLEKWLLYLGKHAHHRLYTSALSTDSDLSLVDVLTYLMFTVSVLHYSMGHIMNGTTDPRYICASVLKSEKNDLWSIVSSRDECLIRLAVYATINRHTYHLTDDFSDLCVDNRGKAIVHSFTQKMRERSAEMEEYNRGKVRPRFLVPSAIGSSAAQ